MEILTQEKPETIFKSGELEIRRLGGELQVVQSGELQPGLLESEPIRMLVGALLAHIEKAGVQRDALQNQVAFLKQDNLAAWNRHAMANRIGADTSDMLLDAKGRIRELEAAQPVSNG